MNAGGALRLAAATCTLALTFCHPGEQPPLPPPKPTNPTNLELSRLERQADPEVEVLDASIVTDGSVGWDGEIELDAGTSATRTAGNAR